MNHLIIITNGILVLSGERYWRACLQLMKIYKGARIIQLILKKNLCHEPRFSHQGTIKSIHTKRYLFPIDKYIFPNNNSILC